jgi:hypothetical protein
MERGETEKSGGKKWKKKENSFQSSTHRHQPLSKSILMNGCKI